MARLDTGWHANSKVLAVGLQAMGLHAWSISYCDHALTDGFIPSGAWPALPGAGAAVKALLVAGLWERADGGFVLHDYTEYNRTRAQVEEYMAAKVRAGQAGGQASAQARARRAARPLAQANGQHVLKQTSKQNPTPGPGPGVNSLAGLHAGIADTPETGPVARRPAPAREAARRLIETASMQASGILKSNDDDGDEPPEVAARLAQRPIGR